MTNDLNHFQMIGRLTRDCEKKNISTGTSICKFSIAVNRKKKNSSGGYDPSVSFFDLCLFGKTADALAEYLRKGQLVAVSGNVEQKRWEQDGENRSQIGLNVQEVQLLPSNLSGSAGKKSEAANSVQPGTTEEGLSFQNDNEYDFPTDLF